MAGIDVALAAKAAVATAAGAACASAKPTLRSLSRVHREACDTCRGDECLGQHDEATLIAWRNISKASAVPAKKAKERKFRALRHRLSESRACHAARMREHAVISIVAMHKQVILEASNEIGGIYRKSALIGCQALIAIPGSVSVLIFARVMHFAAGIIWSLLISTKPMAEADKI